MRSLTRDTAGLLSLTWTLRAAVPQRVRWSGFSLLARYVNQPADLRVQHRFRRTQDLLTLRPRETIRDVLELTNGIDAQRYGYRPELSRVDPPFKPFRLRDK